MQTRTTRTESRFLVSIGLVLMALVIGGCKSSATTDAPAAPQEPVEQTQAAAPIEAVSDARSDFDGNGEPIDRNGNPLNRTFYFGYDKSVLKPADLAALEVHAQILRRNSNRSVVVEGHCDERGTREYNLALGERRANAISSFLRSAGVSSRQIETVSYGEERPEDAGHNEASWARNRRAELSYR